MEKLVIILLFNCKKYKFAYKFNYNYITKLYYYIILGMEARSGAGMVDAMAEAQAKRAEVQKKREEKAAKMGK